MEVPASYEALISLLFPLQGSASGIPLPPSMKPPTRPQSAAPPFPGTVEVYQQCFPNRSMRKQLQGVTGNMRSCPYSHAIHCSHGVAETFFQSCTSDPLGT